MKTAHFYVIVPLIAAVQCVFVITGFMPPLSSYSPGQIVLSIAMMAAMAYMGYTLADAGLKAAAKKGALASLLAVIVICLFAMAGSALQRPVLGVSVPSLVSLALLLLSVCITNMLLLTLCAVLGAFVGRKIGKAKK
jgi:hypothetical protein